MNGMDEQEGAGRHNGRCGDRKHPCPDDSSGDPPAHGRQAVHRSHADDGAGNGVSGADRDARQSGAE